MTRGVSSRFAMCASNNNVKRKIANIINLNIEEINRSKQNNITEKRGKDERVGGESDGQSKEREK